MGPWTDDGRRTSDGKPVETFRLPRASEEEIRARKRAHRIQSARWFARKAAWVVGSYAGGVLALYLSSDLIDKNIISWKVVLGLIIGLASLPGMIVGLIVILPVGILLLILLRLLSTK